MSYAEISMPPLKYLFAFATAYAKLHEGQEHGVLPGFSILVSKREACHILVSSFLGFVSEDYTVI